MQKKKPARERTRAPKEKSDIERRLEALELLEAIVQKQDRDLHNVAHNVAVDREKLQVRMEHFAAEIKARLYALGEDIPKLVSQQDERLAAIAKSVVNQDLHDAAHNVAVDRLDGRITAIEERLKTESTGFGERASHVPEPSAICAAPSPWPEVVSCMLLANHGGPHEIVVGAQHWKWEVYDDRRSLAQ